MNSASGRKSMCWRCQGWLQYTTDTGVLVERYANSGPGYTSAFAGDTCTGVTPVRR